MGRLWKIRKKRDPVVADFCKLVSVRRVGTELRTRPEPPKFLLLQASFLRRKMQRCCYIRGRRGGSQGKVLGLLENWRGASFADVNQQTGFGEPGKGAPHGNENTGFAAHT
jgi:hypothetical protein